TAVAPLDKLPLYIRGGGIVPMLRDTIDTLAPTTDANVESYARDPGVLTVRTAPGADQPPFTLFDGTVIEVKSLARSGNVTPGTKFKQGVLVEVIAWSVAHSAPSSVINTSGGALTPRLSLAELESANEGWFFDSSTRNGTLWIKVHGAADLLAQ